MKRMLLALVALLSFGGPALAQTLAPGEITLTIEALGVSEPDSAYVSQTLRGRGDDEAKARADLATKRAALTASLGKLGIPASAINFGDVVMQPDYSSDAAMAVAVDAAADAAAVADAAAAPAAVAEETEPVLAPMPMSAPPRMATQSVTVTVNDLKTLVAVQAAVPADEEYSGSPNTFYTTRNRDAAHSVAVADALARARTEAEGYAAALGMRVVRIVKVSSEKPGTTWPELMQWFAKIDGRGNPDSEYFLRLAGSTFAGAKVEFVIAPK